MKTICIILFSVFVLSILTAAYGEIIDRPELAKIAAFCLIVEFTLFLIFFIYQIRNVNTNHNNSKHEPRN